MNKELKPCPFCGEEPKQSHSGGTISIQCEGAFCGMASIHGPVFVPDAIIFEWNTRAYEPELQSLRAENERLKAEIVDLKNALYEAQGNK